MVRGAHALVRTALGAAAAVSHGDRGGGRRLISSGPSLEERGRRRRGRRVAFAGDSIIPAVRALGQDVGRNYVASTIAWSNM